jgi:hydroxyacylglutathione hydrolase
MSIFHIPAYTDNYIWVLQSGNDISVIDPGEAQPVLKVLNNQNLNLVDILLTHHHFDHVGGTTELKKIMSGCVYGPEGNIEGVDITISEDDKISTLGYQFKILATPGHTLDHISYVDYENKMVFCGDTLFSAGCGRIFEGTFEQMHESIQKINELDKDTYIYCAHEYTQSNLEFVRSQMNDDFIDSYALELKKKLANGGISIPTKLSLERRINPFLLNNIPSDLKGNDEVEKFTELRTRKDNF